MQLMAQGALRIQVSVTDLHLSTILLQIQVEQLTNISPTIEIQIHYIPVSMYGEYYSLVSKSTCGLHCKL